MPQELKPKVYKYSVPYSIKVVKNDSTNNIQFKLKDPSIPEGLTGASILMQVRDKVSEAVLVERSTDNFGIVIVDPIECIFNLKPYKCQVNQGVYKYDIEISYQDGITVKTRFDGDYTVFKDTSEKQQATP